MGIRRARVTWFAVIRGLPAAGTGRTYHDLVGHRALALLHGPRVLRGHAARLYEHVRRGDHTAAVDHERQLRGRVEAVLLVRLDPPARDRPGAARRDHAELDARSVGPTAVVAHRAIGL